MKKIILLLSAVLLWALPVSVSAQNKNNDKAKQQRKEQFDRFCKFRRDFMMKQIGLSEQEAKQFFPLYEEMEGKKWTVDREARTFARKIVRSETAVSDVEPGTRIEWRELGLNTGLYILHINGFSEKIFVP